MQAAGFVLVGGRSSRMGYDKARLPIRSHLLVEDVCAKVRCVVGNVAIIGPSSRYGDLGVDCLDDLCPLQGPLGGIETALASQRGEVNLVVACDMPNLKVEWLECLLRAASNLREDCVVATDSAGVTHPLCSVWKQACLPPVSKALKQGRLRVLDIVEKLKAHRVSISDVIYNVNTPEEWKAWQARETELVRLA